MNNLKNAFESINRMSKEFEISKKHLEDYNEKNGYILEKEFPGLSNEMRDLAKKGDLTGIKEKHQEILDKIKAKDGNSNTNNGQKSI